MTSMVFLTMGAAVIRWEQKAVAYREGLKVVVNGEEIKFDAQPMIVEPGWIMCQLEPVVKKMGWLVSWDDPNSTLKIVSMDYSIASVLNPDSVYTSAFLKHSESWEASSNLVADLITQFQKNPNNQQIKDQLLNALGDLWHYSEVMLGIKPTPKFEAAHKYLVMAMEETKAAVEDCRLWVKTLDSEAGKNGIGHLDRKELYLGECLTQLKLLIK